MASRQLAHLGGKQCRDEDRNAPLPMGFAFKYSDAYNITYVFQGGVFDPANLPAWFVRVLDPRRDGCCETTSALYRHLCIIGSSHGMRNEMHLSTKDLQITLRCIHLISGRAAPSHHCHQISGVNNPAGEADSCKAVISLRNPWAGDLHLPTLLPFPTLDPAPTLQASFSGKWSRSSSHGNLSQQRGHRRCVLLRVPIHEWTSQHQL